MHIGFGATVLAKGLDNNGLDGIGYYSKELANGLRQCGVDLAPVVFGFTMVHELFGMSPQVLPRFKYGLGSGLLGLDYPDSKSLSSKIDLYHATDHLIPRLKGVPVVATIMDAIPLARPQWTNQKLRYLKNLLWKRTVTWADHVVTISEYSKKDLIDFFDLTPEKITVTPLGVDQRYFDLIDGATSNDYLDRMGLRRGRFLLFVGTLQPRKNVETLLTAYLQLPTHIRHEIPLVIVGRAGWGCTALVAKLESYAKAENADVQWLKGVTDLEKRILLQNGTALVFPSLYEGFGLPVLEAFASSLPVIASNTTSIPEVAQDAALLVDPMDAEQLTLAMKKIVDEDGLRAELKAAGMMRARAFTWLRCAERTREVYRGVLSA